MAHDRDETIRKVYRTLLERFGEPIKGSTATVGISDDRSGKVATRGEGEEEEISQKSPRVGDDEGELLLDEEDIDEATPPGMESTVKKLKRRKGVKNPHALAWSLYHKKKNKSGG